jgi:Ca2+/Na+ antiporter
MCIQIVRWGVRGGTTSLCLIDGRATFLAVAVAVAVAIVVVVVVTISSSRQVVQFYKHKKKRK